MLPNPETDGNLKVTDTVQLMFSVPLYFQITARSSNTESGAHLVPAVVGNAIGGILSGVLIKRCVQPRTRGSQRRHLTLPNPPRSGRYKALIIIAVTMSSFSYLLLMLRWHGNTNIWESLYIFPSGFGTGIAQSAVFISLQAVIQDPSHLAPAISFMYLSSTLAVTLGLPLGNAVMQTVLRRTLRARLLGLGFELGAIAEVSVLFLLIHRNHVLTIHSRGIDCRKHSLRRGLCRPRDRPGAGGRRWVVCGRVVV